MCGPRTPAKPALSISEARTCHRVVEDAGAPLRVGHVARDVKRFRHENGDLPVGNRKVRWAVDASGAVVVAHAPAGGGEPVAYRVALVFTELPSGGLRWWWSCPGCGSRVGVLYLPAVRDRLGCRACCGLRYGSQYGRPGTRRKGRTRVVVERERRVWTAETGWVVRSLTRTRSRS